MPDERVSHDIHVIAQAEIHIGIGWAKIIAIRAFLRMDEGPLQIVLRGNLVELSRHESNVFVHLFPGSVDVACLDCAGRRNGAVDGHANTEAIIVGVLERGLVGR